MSRSNAPEFAAELAGADVPLTYRQSQPTTPRPTAVYDPQTALQLPSFALSGSSVGPLSSFSARSALPQWQYTVSQPSSAISRPDPESGWNVPPQTRASELSAHRYTRSASDVTQAQDPLNKPLPDAISPSDVELQGSLQSALRLQADAFAEIARSKSSRDVKASAGQLPRRSHSTRVAEQIRRDEELAQKLSMENLVMERGRRVDVNQAAPRRPYDQQLDVNSTAPRRLYDPRSDIDLNTIRETYDDQAEVNQVMPEQFHEVRPPILGPYASIPFHSGDSHPTVYHEAPDTKSPSPFTGRGAIDNSFMSYNSKLENVPTSSSQNASQYSTSNNESTNYRGRSEERRETYRELTPPLPVRPIVPVFDQSENERRRQSLDPRRLSENSYHSDRATPRESAAVCDQCQQERELVSFCPVCSFNYCHDHWQSQPLHRERLYVNGVPHEKTNPHLARRIMSIIEPSVNDAEQNQLRLADDDTTWFGVLPDQTGQLLFHDFGRYEEFLSQSMFTPKSGQFPSLISFVGPTGAGKSTIVKGLVKLFDSGNEHLKHQTPVVGLTQHQAVPTSGEVHLYWDPSSLLTNRPLMYADCEGLGGGSREPMAARATSSRERKTLTKEKKDKGRARSGSESLSQNDLYGQQSKHMSIRDFGFRHGSPSYSSTPPKNTPMAKSPSNERRSFIEYQESVASRISYSSYSPVPEAPEPQEGWTPGSGKVFRGITRKIEWAQEKEKRSRQFIVENLYPRLLYTFSDIVILVMRNAKQLEMEIERLIRWAATAIEKSSNQPMLPFAIIVINAVDNRTDESLLDIGNATQKLFDDLKFTRENNRDIDTTKDLLLAYYIDVKIVFVPEKGRPKLVWKQYKVLYGEIHDAVSRSQSRRQNARLLLSSDQFNPYLQFAFAHFSRTLDVPFDFVRASSAFNDIQPQFNPILCLIKDYRAHFPDCKSLDIFIKVAPLVASSIMLDVVRKKRRGNASAVFPTYQDSFKQALKTFFDEEWPCEARHPKLNERCIIVRTRHDTKGHQLASGRVWNGAYVSQGTGDPEPIFNDAVYSIFRSLDRNLMDKQWNRGLSGAAQEAKIAFHIHLHQIIDQRCEFLQNTTLFVSHRICLCCLWETPLHPLLCGHVICNRCFESAGHKEREHVIRLDRCPIYRKNWTQGQSFVEIVQRPSSAGLRIMTLDGGGVRALIQLVILRLIKKRMALEIPIVEFFDLIVGTSGGGIVALAIGEKNMSVTDAIHMFKRFAKESFRPRKDTGVPLLGRIIQLKYQSQYESQGLESTLKETFGHNLLFSGTRSHQSPSRCKVAITTTDTNREARLLSNYNRAPRVKTPYQFQRFERPQQEVSVWEAARATSAAPGFFKSFFKHSNGHTYQDGALKLNNPVLAADYERQIIWPECANALPDILLSIGTGYFPDAKMRNSEPGPRYGVGLVDGVKALVQISRDAIESDLDCEKTWDDYVQCTVAEGSERRTRFHRLTVPIYGPKIELDAVDKMEDLEQRTQAYYKPPPNGVINSASQQLDAIAAQLTASLFYFEIASKVHLTVTGTIKCRLPQGVTRNSSLSKLARYLLGMRPAARQFRIYSSLSSYRSWIDVPISDGLLLGVETQSTIFQIQVTFDLLEAGVPSAIYFCQDKYEPQMISGFPRSLHGHDPGSPPPPVASEPNLVRYNSNLVTPVPGTPSKSKSPDFPFASLAWSNAPWERGGRRFRGDSVSPS